ncbi:outer membrane beta-barrel protein [Methylobacterium sp. 77]|uniref:outer membrane protein n=1 Tax=Methylobacterium sp. 77 TaxID=1101192 RepID=UPI00039B60FA|nr:outer membrane beta-barrel protein [Methylobacterium sp. 77]
MRTATLALLTSVTIGWFSTAQAADLDYGVLRGPDYEPVSAEIDWNGFYFGAHAGYTSASLNQEKAFKNVLADNFRVRDIESQFGVSSFLVMPSARVDGTSFGGFAGYNYQFDEVVIGVEVDYTRFDKAGTSTNEISRQLTTSAGMSEVVRLYGDSTTKIEDYGTIRARGGWVIGNFLPFVTGGIAIGRAVVNDQALVQNYGYDAKTYSANQSSTSGSALAVYNHGYKTFNPNYPEVNSSPSGQRQTTPLPAVALTKGPSVKTVAGVTLGGGLEYALTQNIILRGEYQYVLFDDFGGHTVNLNTVRGGAAVKF